MGCLRCLPAYVKSFHVKILLLDKQELIQEVQDKTTGQDLLDNIFKYLNLMETAYFGLRYQDNDNQTHWLEPGKRVCRQIRGAAPITLYLGVKFYAADPCRLVEEITRYQFFLQVKQDVLQGRLPVSQDLAVELAALALQSELGDYNPKQHSQGYVSEFRFTSAQTEEFEADVEAAHASMSGLGIVPATAEMTYLEKVKWLDMYGVDLHPVIGEDNIEYFLGLTPSGIIVLRNRSKVGNYFWPRITKIYFKGKYFMLRVRDKNNEDSTYGFETPSRQACKHLWKCCVEHHAFFRLVQVNPSFGGTGVFSLGSRFRYSGHTEKQVMQQVQTVKRQPPQFERRPSRRLSRRSDPGSGHPENARSPVVMSSLANGSLKRQPPALQQGSRQQQSDYPNRHRANSLPRHVSLMANSMRHSSNNNNDESLQDLSLQSLQWLESRGLFDSKQSARRASLPEQIHANGYYRRSRSQPHNGGGQSDAESDAASGVSWVSGVQHQSRRRNESGSESERSVRRTHRSRRKRQGSYKLVDSNQENQNPQQQQLAISASRKSGYVNSGAETEVEASQASLKRNRRRQRSRSRSPGGGDHSSRARLPPEVLQQLEFGLVEPSEENRRGEIPFKNVETTAASGTRHYYNARAPTLAHHPRAQLKTATTRSVVSAMESKASTPQRSASMVGGPTTTDASRPRSMHHQLDSQFIWPPNVVSSGSSKFVATSTPVSASSPNPRSFHNLGLPVTSTQYKSPYAVPAGSSSSSGNSALFHHHANGQQAHSRGALPPTVLIQPNEAPSPQLNNGRPPAPPVPSVYPTTKYQSRVFRSNGFTMPSGDEMSTEL